MLNEKDAINRAGFGDVEAMLMTLHELVELVDFIGRVGDPTRGTETVLDGFRHVDTSFGLSST